MAVPHNFFVGEVVMSNRFLKFITSVIFIVFCSSCVSPRIALLPVKEKPNLSAINDELIMLGSQINHPKQKYPINEFKIGQEGWVQLRCDINKFGVPENIEVIDYSPVDSFVSRAVKYMSTVRYKPYYAGGKVGRVIARHFVMEFKLGEDYESRRDEILEAYENRKQN